MLKVINFWSKYECFIPYNFENQLRNYNEKSIYTLNENKIEPWLNNENIDTYRYIIFLGIFNSQEAVQKMQEILGKSSNSDPEEEPSSISTCYGTITLDNSGCYTGDLSLSTFPWAVGQISQNRIRNMDWSRVFEEYRKSANESANNIFKESCNKQSLNLFIEELVSLAGWQPSVFESPQVLIKKSSEKYNKENTNKKQDVEEQAQGEILNSFFIRDLERVYLSAHKGMALNEYLSDISSDENKHDLLNDRQKLKQVLSACDLPLGRWFFPKEQSLSLMQQAAVNIALQNKQGMFSVNGPPGTGKTTLLQDIIAALVTERAQELCKYKNNPTEAFFSQPIEGLSTNGFSLSVYKLKRDLRGFGIVVASSNNRAVENISAELPLEKYGGSYFKEMARSMYGEKAWGLISAVLGKSELRSNFIRDFWFKKNDLNMRTYLEASCDSGKVGWKKAVTDFESALQKVGLILENAQKSEEGLKKQWQQQIDEYQCKIESMEKDLANLKQQAEKFEEDYSTALQNKDACYRTLEITSKAQPGCLAQLLMQIISPEALKKRHLQLEKDTERINLAKAYVDEIDKKKNQNKDELECITNNYGNAKKELNILKLERKKYKKIISEAKGSFGKFFPDEDFWGQNNDDLQKMSPWNSPEFNVARTDLFQAALKVHEAFIIVNKNIFLNNLSAFMDLLNNKLDVNSYKPMVPALWNSFFCVIPVVSTTFSSFDRMFKGVGSEKLGWLFIDEAGQALPQAAVGAIWRSKRVIVAGDPFQLEPILNVPAVIAHSLAKRIDIPDQWIPGPASVQTLADRINIWGSEINGQWVGCPLRVHRRCQEPMFSIANEIAYQKLMVYASKPYKEEHLPESCWYDIKGECTSNDNKWVESQGYKVLELLKELFQLCGYNIFNRVYIITPFRTVKNELTRYLRLNYRKVVPESPTLENCKKMQIWLNDSLGTIHTFQGKQNNIVILMLGADKKRQGSTQWAASKPNMLNVAVSRAEHRVYIVGDYELWAQLSYFNIAAQRLRRIST